MPFLIREVPLHPGVLEVAPPWCQPTNEVGEEEERGNPTPKDLRAPRKTSPRKTSHLTL